MGQTSVSTSRREESFRCGVLQTIILRYVDVGQTAAFGATEGEASICPVRCFVSRGVQRDDDGNGKTFPVEAVLAARIKAPIGPVIVEVRRSALDLNSDKLASGLPGIVDKLDLAVDSDVSHWGFTPD